MQFSIKIICCCLIIMVALFHSGSARSTTTRSSRTTAAEIATQQSRMKVRFTRFCKNSYCTDKLLKYPCRRARHTKACHRCRRKICPQVQKVCINFFGRNNC